MANTPLPRTARPGRSSMMTINVPSGKWSTGAIMRVIVPLSLELVLFNEVWYLVLMPPITLVVLVCNLGLFFVLVRPKSWETRILGMMLGGAAAVFAAAANYLLAGPGPIPVGAIGSLVRYGLVGWAEYLPNASRTFGGYLVLISQNMTVIEGILVDILGVAMIWAGGRLDQWYRAGGIRLSFSPMTMSTITSTPTTVLRPFTSTVHRITVDEYERIVSAGALENPSRVELVAGYLVVKLPKNPGHSHSATSAYEILKDRLPAGWSARLQGPVRIPAFDEPEPDVSVVRGSRSDYRHRFPEPADVALVIEVSESTLSGDRGETLAAYAKGRIPVYWIINLVDRQVEVYTVPGATDYQSRQDYTPGQQVPVVIAGQPLQPIAVDDLLP